MQKGLWEREEQYERVYEKKLLQLAYLTLGYVSRLLFKRCRRKKYLLAIFTFIIMCVCVGLFVCMECVSTKQSVKFLRYPLTFKILHLHFYSTQSQSAVIVFWTMTVRIHVYFYLFGCFSCFGAVLIFRFIQRIQSENMSDLSLLKHVNWTHSNLIRYSIFWGVNINHF